MSFLTRLLAHDEATYGEVRPRPIECCIGKELMPRWASPELMDDDSKAMGFVCHECGREYPPSQVRGRRLLGSPNQA